MGVKYKIVYYTYIILLKLNLFGEICGEVRGECGRLCVCVGVCGEVCGGVCVLYVSWGYLEPV